MQPSRLARPIVAFALLAAAGLPSPARAAKDPLPRLAAAAGQKRAVVRIGLAADHRISIGGRGSFRIVDPDSGEAVWKDEFLEEIQVIAEGGPKTDVPSVFRVQVGAFAGQEAAQKEMRRLQEIVGATGVVHHDPDRAIWRVRIGQADDRLALNPLMDRLRATGVQGLWIAEEPAQVIDDVRLRLVDESFASIETGRTRLVVLPGKAGTIEVGGRPYRGLIELRVSGFGTVQPINWIETESYLRGVVPAELGPEVWPELHALRAQAVAARTYVWRNRDQFNDEGFDLCATPRCQVYKGAAAEHPLSDRAIASTDGEILSFKGEAIVALYTATCGGHTEDGHEIFPEHRHPYLRGVACRAEGQALADQRGVVRGRPVPPISDETGADVTRDWALLAAAGVIPGSSRDAAQTAFDAAELRRWTSALASIAGLPEPSGPPGGAGSLAAAAVTLMTDLGWSERATVLLAADDLAALLRGTEAASLSSDAQRALGYLAWSEGLRAFPDGKLHAARPASRARLAPAFVRIGESYSAFGLARGVVAGVGEGNLRIVQGKGRIRLPLARDVVVFGRVGGEPVAVEQLEIWPGDRVRFRKGAAGAVDFLELLPPIKGTSDDRSAQVYSWEVRKTRRQLESAINRRISVGRLEDLRVLRRGVSGRVVELEVVGTKATTVVRGFDVRRLLDLRESLLVIETQRDERGRIEAVVFAGKGWGHGVGLCQVGAYGMALRGASYREILAHYYTGVKLVRIAPDTP